MTDRTTGTVKWFNPDKGFGFISQDDSVDDLFVHYSEILTDGHRTLLEGDAVEFVVTNGPKGLHASAVIVIAR